MDNHTEIIKELSKTPVGKYNLRKRLTKTVAEDGTVTYDVREYAPRPMAEAMSNDNTEKVVKEYVPARGITIELDDLKKICKALRKQLYEERHTNKYEAEKEIEEFLANINVASEPIDLSDFDDSVIEEEDYNDNDDDPVVPYDYNEELGYDVYIPIITFDKNEESYKALNTVSWHNQPIVYDLRKYVKKINSRGYEEYTPELDKGITLNDIEAEMLCQGIESLDEELAKETEDLREDDYEENSNSIDFNLTSEERNACKKAFDMIMQNQLSEHLTRSARGCAIGDKDADKTFNYLAMIRHKIINGERLYDTEANICTYIFREAIPSIDDWIERCNVRKVANNMEYIISERKRLPNPTYLSKGIKTLTATKGEFNIASVILHIILNILYGEPDEEEIENDKKVIDNLVITNIDLCYDNGKYMNDDYKKDSGEQFLKDLISGLERSANSPISEPPY